MTFKTGDQVKVTIPIGKRIRALLTKGMWAPRYGTYITEREDYAAYIILDANNKLWYIAWEYVRSNK